MVDKVFTPSPSLPPPPNSVGVIGWMRKNLFSSLANSLLTVAGAWLVIWLVSGALEWGVFKADWIGSSREDCSREGACWVFVIVRMQQFIYGFYPTELLWRPNLVFALLALQILWLTVERIPFKRAGALVGLFIFPVVAYVLLHGGSFGLALVETSEWGGLLLTLVLAVVGIVAALPIGIVLALGRRSNMPVISMMSTVFIEVWRGVPLITVLFMASVMLPLFMDTGTSADKVVRALIGIILFESAYMAEVVRGGLQAIPKGQFEAAAALGLNYPKTMGLIVLPQALKIMIPGIVNTFIALFKDTSLVLIIGLLDIMSMVKTALADPKWLGFAVEGLVFAGLVFWVFCFSISRYSQYLEKKLHTGHKR